MPLDSYDTAVNVLGGLRDAETLFGALNDFFRHSNEQGFAQEGLTKIHRTEQTKGRVERMVRAVVLQFRNDDHRELLWTFQQSNAPMRDREFVLFWHLALNNRLFREISVNVFSQAYFAGRAVLGKDDVVGYVKDFLGKNQALGLAWSETTIDRLGSKYLNLMKKLNFLSGVRTKSFSAIRPSSEALTLFLYITRINQPDRSNILAHELLPLSFIQKEDFVGRLKKLSVKGAFEMNFNGVDLKIDLTRPYGEIAHVLYR